MWFFVLLNIKKLDELFSRETHRYKFKKKKKNNTWNLKKKQRKKRTITDRFSIRDLAHFIDRPIRGWY